VSEKGRSSILYVHSILRKKGSQKELRMYHSLLTSQHSLISGRIALALIFVLALTTTGNTVAYARLANAPAEQANIIPVTGVGDQAQDCAGANLEICLHWSPEQGQSNLSLIPVTGGGMDFGYSYWVVVGPAGGTPINVGTTGK
jgi:hypothetical protein